MINKMGERVCTVSIPDDPTLFIEQSKSARKKIEFVVIEKLGQISIAADGTSPENAETKKRRMNSFVFFVIACL